MIEAVASSQIVDQMLQSFLTMFQKDYGRIEEIAKGLFYYLSGLQITLSAIWLMFKGDPIDAAVKTTQIFFTLAVFYTLVLFSGTWIPQLLNGFIAAGSNVSGVASLTPSSIIDQGMSIGFAIFDNFSHWGWISHPFGSLISCIILTIIIVIYALLAGEMTVILIKSYMLISLSGLMFAFGSNEIVRPISINYFKAILDVGLQLLAFYLIMEVGIQIGSNWSALINQAAENHELKPFLVIMMAVIIFYMIVKKVPFFVGNLARFNDFKIKPFGKVNNNE